MGKVAGLAAMAWVLLASGMARAEPKTWEYAGGGQWPQVNAPATRASPDPTLDRVEQLIRAEQNKAAEKLAIQWLLSHKTDPQHDRGLFLLAQALYQYGDRIKSYYYLDELMDEHPHSRLYG